MSHGATWKREEQSIEETAGNISTLRKEITKETQIDANVQLAIRQKVEDLKQNAVVLANRLQNEKHKNVLLKKIQAELDAIIRYIQTQIDQDKQHQATNSDGKDAENLDNFEGRLKKLQYDLGHLSGKVNRLGENVDTKRTKIRQNRTERVIDSGIFRNIEKQLITSDLKFKKLLIQKIKYQGEYDRLLKEYEEMKKQTENWKRESKDKVDSTPSRRTLQVQPYSQRKFVEIERKADRIYTHDIRPTDGPLDAELEPKDQDKLIILHKILSHLGLETCEELLHYFNNIDFVNDGIFNQMNNLSNQSGQIEDYLLKIKKDKKNNEIKFYQQKKQLSKKLMNYKKAKEIKLRIDQTSKFIDTEIQQFANLLNQNQFKTFQQDLGLQPMTAQSICGCNFGQVLEGLEVLESNVQKYLRGEVKVQEEQSGITSRAVCQQKLLEMLNKVRPDECMNVMKKEEFQLEYSKLIKNNSNTKRGKLVHSTSKRSSINIMSKR